MLGEEHHAIVDPFIESVLPGDVFFVMLVPNSTKNLVHHYEITITDLPDAPAKDADAFTPEPEEDDNECRNC
jgi:hypothetical protein